MDIKVKKIFQNILIIVIFIGLFLLIIVKSNMEDTKSSIPEKIDKNKLTKIEILATKKQMEYLKDNTDNEPYIKVDVIINGKKIKDCGLRTKGGYIYTHLQIRSNPTRFGYLLELDYYKRNQSYDGITKFFLNTNMYDQTTIREMICYDIYETAGVKTPKRSLCDLTIAGKDEGIYTVVEVETENFIKRTYGDNDGVIYKPKLNIENEYKEYIQRVLDGKTFGSISKNKIRKLDNSLKNIMQNNDIDKYMDVSSMIDFLAVCFLIDNNDSYISQNSRNYYIYQQGDKITFLPYDLELILYDEDDIDFSVLSYEKYKNNGNRHIIYNILNNDNYMQEYKQKMKTIINNLENKDYIYNQIDYYAKLVNISMLYNENNSYPHGFFKENVSKFKESMHLRIKNVKKELEQD